MNDPAGLTVDDLFVDQTGSLTGNLTAYAQYNASKTPGSEKSASEWKQEISKAVSLVPRERYENSCHLLEQTRRALTSIEASSSRDVQRLENAHLRLAEQEAALRALEREHHACAAVCKLDDAGVLQALKEYQLIERLKGSGQ